MIIIIFIRASYFRGIRRRSFPAISRQLASDISFFLLAKYGATFKSFSSPGHRHEQLISLEMPLIMPLRYFPAQQLYFAPSILIFHFASSPARQCLATRVSHMPDIYFHSPIIFVCAISQSQQELAVSHVSTHSQHSIHFPASWLESFAAFYGLRMMLLAPGPPNAALGAPAATSILVLFSPNAVHLLKDYLFHYRLIYIISTILDIYFLIIFPDGCLSLSCFHKCLRRHRHAILFSASYLMAYRHDF